MLVNPIIQIWDEIPTGDYNMPIEDFPCETCQEPEFNCCFCDLVTNCDNSLDSSANDNSLDSSANDNPLDSSANDNPPALIEYVFGYHDPLGNKLTVSWFIKPGDNAQALARQGVMQTLRAGWLEDIEVELTDKIEHGEGIGTFKLI